MANLRVSCADEAGERVVISGDRSSVLAELRSLGYMVKSR